MLGMMLSRARKMTVTGWTKGAGNPDQTKPIQPLQKMNPSIKKKNSEAFRRTAYKKEIDD